MKDLLREMVSERLGKEISYEERSELEEVLLMLKEDISTSPFDKLVVEGKIKPLPWPICLIEFQENRINRIYGRIPEGHEKYADTLLQVGIIAQCDYNPKLYRITGHGHSCLFLINYKRAQLKKQRDCLA